MARLVCSVCTLGFIMTVLKFKKKVSNIMGRSTVPFIMCHKLGKPVVPKHAEEELEHPHFRQ